MITNLKALLVILVLAISMFSIAKPICLRYMRQEDFVRRRNMWVLLTVVAFVSPSYWAYALFALPVMVWAGQRDSNPVALYLLLLHVVPPISAELPSFLINRLFELDNYRILAFAILLPAAWRLIFTAAKNKASGYALVDSLILAYIVLQVVMNVPYEDVTNTLRRGVLLLLDFALVFYVVSRSCKTQALLTEAITMFCLACALLAPIAIFESQKGWLLYQGLGSTWGISFEDLYLLRGDSLRAQAAGGHSLVLGYLFSMAFGFWLFLSDPLPTWKRLLGGVGIWVALAAAYSRAPWIAAVLTFFCYQALNPNGLMRLTKTLVLAVPVVGLLLISPLGASIIDNIPFIGTVDSGNVDYRQQLAESSWELIKSNPLFGDAFFMTHLEHLRQGQGIIDLVNVYATIAMGIGLVGLALFLGPFLLGMGKALATSRKNLASDPTLSRLGASLVACMIGTAFFMATCSFYLGLSKTYYIFSAFALAYAQLAPQKHPAAVQKSST